MAKPRFGKKQLAYRRAVKAARHAAAKKAAPAKKGAPGKAGRTASPVPTPHLEPGEQQGFLQNWNELVDKGIDATGAYRDVVTNDPLARAEIQQGYVQNVKSLTQSLAGRGLGAHGVQPGQLSDVNRTRDLALTRQATLVSNAKQLHDSTIGAIQTAQGALSLGAVGMKLGNLYGDDYYASPGAAPTAPGAAPAPGAPGAAPGAPGAAKPLDPNRAFQPAAWQRAALAKLAPGPGGNKRRADLLNLWTKQRNAGIPKVTVAPGTITPRDRRLARRAPKRTVKGPGTKKVYN